MFYKPIPYLDYTTRSFPKFCPWLIMVGLILSSHSSQLLKLTIVDDSPYLKSRLLKGSKYDVYAAVHSAQHRTKCVFCKIVFILED